MGEWSVVDGSRRCRQGHAEAAEAEEETARTSRAWLGGWAEQVDDELADHTAAREKSSASSRAPILSRLSLCSAGLLLYSVIIANTSPRRWLMQDLYLHSARGRCPLPPTLPQRPLILRSKTFVSLRFFTTLPLPYRQCMRAKSRSTRPQPWARSFAEMYFSHVLIEEKFIGKNIATSATIS